MGAPVSPPSDTRCTSFWFGRTLSGAANRTQWWPRLDRLLGRQRSRNSHPVPSAPPRAIELSGDRTANPEKECWARQQLKVLVVEVITFLQVTVAKLLVAGE
eukprot:m.84050 g.84050  ORF g.84050 m.84050 type:complete len:102 (+) comp11261_c0_seq4:1643-1948(+)